MFFKRRRDTNNKNKTRIFLNTDGLSSHKMPIVTLDHSWHQLMAEIKTPSIEKLEKELTELLKIQGKLNTDYIEYTKMKKNMLDTILDLTHEAFELKSPEAIKKIEDQQKMILKINSKLESVEKELDDLPTKIQKINGDLLEHSVNICYEYMNEYKSESQKLDEEIQVLREEVLKKTERKKSYDEKVEQLYQYLHQSVGPDFIEKLDRIYWEE